MDFHMQHRTILFVSLSRQKHGDMANIQNDIWAAHDGIFLQ